MFQQEGIGASALETYMIDVNIQEPMILQLYSKVLPEVERALPKSYNR